MTNIQKIKQELCLSCMECCKTMIIPTMYGFILDESIAVLCDMRGIKYANTDTGPFVMVPTSCRFLGNKGCKIYDKRPDVCRKYDGRKIDMMKGICKWNQIKEVTCNKCMHLFESVQKPDKILCPECRSNESLSIR